MKLWRYLEPSNPTKEGIYYFAKKKVEGFHRTTGGVIRDAIHLAELMEKFRKDEWDAYIQLNPSYLHTKKRSSAEDVSAYRWFSMDIDPVISDPPRDVFQLMTPAPLVGLQTSVFFVDSGRGIQLWWRAFEIPLRKDGSKEDREKLRWLNSMLLKETFVNDDKWKVDFLPDLPRLVRMPQTFNSKTKRLAGITFYPVEDAEWIDTLKAVEWAGDPPPPPEPPKLSNFNWQNALPHLSLMAKTFILDGVNSKDADSPGRHHAAVAAARSLRDANVPYEGALVAVLRGAQRCRPKVDEDPSFTTAEVMRIVAGAYNIE